MLKHFFLFITLACVFHSNIANAFICDTVNIRKDGRRQGLWEKKYFLSKKLKSTCEFEHGKRSGQAYTYYKSGFVKTHTQYRNNKKDVTTCFYKNRVRFESIKRCIKYENGKKKETIKNPGIEMFN